MNTQLRHAPFISWRFNFHATMILASDTHCNQPDAPIIAKIGGSLFHRIPDLVPVLCASERPVLIIPRGGPFADAVRQCNVNDDTAHWMAVAAMDQYGLYIASHGIPTTTEMANPKKTTFFLPYGYVMLNDVLPHTWDVTSDTIAAWVAGRLHLDLLLLKSVDGIFLNGILQNQVHGPVESDVTDPFFIPFVVKKQDKSNDYQWITT